MASMYHFLGVNSYLTQCWYPFPLIFMEVRTRQLPTKWAEYPTPLDVLKLKRNQKSNRHDLYTDSDLLVTFKFIASFLTKKMSQHFLYRHLSKCWFTEDFLSIWKPDDFCPVFGMEGHLVTIQKPDPQIVQKIAIWKPDSPLFEGSFSGNRTVPPFRWC